MKVSELLSNEPLGEVTGSLAEEAGWHCREFLKEVV